MAKRLFAWVLVLAMVLSLMPAVSMGAAAAGEDKHTDHTGWTAWSDKTKLPTAAGKYYLTVDVQLSAAWTLPAGHVQLCLDGHTITKTGTTRIFTLNSGSELSIYDCVEPYNAQGEYVGGKVVGGDNANNAMIIVARATSTKKNAVLNLYGGRLCGNRPTKTGLSGGAVYLQTGQVNKAGGVFNMYGGEIFDNESQYGGAVSVPGETVANRGDQPAAFHMYGGKIHGNNSTTGTLYATNDGILDIQGGQIVENNTTNGSAIYATGDTTITLKNVEITENTATSSSTDGNGSAVCLRGLNIRLTVGGETVVANNKNHANGCDILLNNDASGNMEKVYVDGLTGGNIRFTVKDTAVTTADQVVAFAGSDKTYMDGALTFVSGTESKSVGLVDGQFSFVKGHSHDGVLYQPWPEGEKLPSEGNYYLTKDVTLKDANANRATVGGGKTLHLCMNGKTISGNKTQGRAFVIEDGNFYLNDCTTVYDAEGCFVSGGKVVDFVQAGSGAALFVNHADAVVEVTGVEFSKNICTGTNADYGGGAMQLRSNKTPAKFTGCLFTENSSKGAAGAIALRQSASIELVDTVISKNSAVSYGAFYTRDSNVTFDGCKITENTASGSISAVYIVGKPTVIFKDTTVTGNTAPSTATYGAIHAATSTATVKLTGKTVITGNTVKDGAACNLCLYKTEAAVIDVTGLTAGSNVGISFLKERITAGFMAFTTAGMTENNGYCVSDLSTYAVDLDEQGRLALVDPSSIITHIHKLCNDDSCSSHGSAVKFKAWDKTDSLPTSGNYYLTADVVLTAAATTTNLNLCLNGFTVTQTVAGQRILNVGNASNTVTASLTDCQGTGKLTGGSATYGSAVSIRHNSTFNLYGGIITGNASTSEGTVYMQGNTPTGNTFNMYGGQISGNSARVGAAVSVGAPAATVTKLPKVNIYGGTITGNTTTQTGGAIHTSGMAELTIAGGTITGNKASTTGGGIQLGAGAKLTLTGGQITDNEATRGAGIYASAQVASITVSGAPQVTGNAASGKLNNLYLEGNVILTLGDVAADAKIGITAMTIGRAISSQSDKDYTANFVGDNSKMPISYKDKTLWIDNRVETSDHNHCVCDGVKAGPCDHTSQMWIKWGDDEDEIGTLPTASGYYFLTTDIALDSFVSPLSEQDIFLCLNGKTVKAAENDRHFNVPVDTVFTVTDCAAAPGGFTGGNRTFGGSVNINAGGVLNLYNGRFYENTAPDSEGGAIYLQSGRTVDGGVFNMYGGIIENNSALYGGGIRAAGLNTGAEKLPSIVNIYGGTITGNKAVSMVSVNATTGKEVTTNGQGGGIACQNDSVLNLYGGTVSNNTSPFNGGGIYLIYSTFNMEGGTITGNKAGNFGGAFFDAIGTVNLKGGTISNNQSSVRGGAFVANGSVMDIYQVTISGNSSVEGGVTYMNQGSRKVNGVTTIYPAKVTVHDGAVITGNIATKNAGGFLVANPDVQLIIEGGQFTKNKAANGAALMIWRGATVTMKGGKISNNSVDLGIGGAVYASNDSTFVMEGGTISGNSARLGGGVYGDRAVLNLNGGSISGNTARVKITWKDGKEVKSGGQGAGVYIQGTVLNIRGTSINSNRAESSGGGVVMSRQTVTTNGVQTNILPKVTMTGGSISYNYSAAAAGGLLVQSSGTVTNIYGGTISGNESKSGGGGVYVSTKATLNMTGGTISGNKAGSAGGGLYVAQGVANVSNVTFKKNTSVANAAQLLVTGNECVFTAKNCKFLEGESKTAGVAVIQSRAHATFENCDFGNNTATNGAGGAMYISTRSYGDMIGCKFYNNKAANNAGALMISNFANVTVADSDFTENSSETLGGAAYVSPASTLTVTGTTFNKCTSATRGGALLCRGNIFLTDCVVENCTAVTEGGGISTDVNTMGGSGIMRGLVVKNTIIRNNTAGGQGGGIYGWKGCRIELYDSEITGNVSPADGGAIWAYEDLELHGTKITGNTSGGEGYAVYMNDSNFDGESYMASKNKLSGNTIIRDNNGKNLYMGPDVVFAITGEGLGQDAHIQLELDSGVITQRILGAFHYEGGEQLYTVTYGTRSVTEPEYDPTLEEKQEDQQQAAMGGDVLLYVGIGVFAAAVIAVVGVLIAKKKKVEKKV